MNDRERGALGEQTEANVDSNKLQIIINTHHVCKLDGWSAGVTGKEEMDGSH